MLRVQGKTDQDRAFRVARAALIVERLQEGVTCEALGKELGITKQRVYEIAKDSGGVQRCPEGHVPFKELAARAGVSPDCARLMVQRGDVVSVKLGKFRFVRMEGVVRPCAMCGAPRDSRTRYCAACSEIARRKVRKRIGWRSLHRRMGKPLPPCLACKLMKPSPLIRQAEEIAANAERVECVKKTSEKYQGCSAKARHTAR